MKRRDISEVIDRALAEAGLDVNSSSLEDVMNTLRRALAADDSQLSANEQEPALEPDVLRRKGGCGSEAGDGACHRR